MTELGKVQVHLHHIAIQTADFERSFAFYTGALGLPVVKMPFVFKGKRTLAWLDAGGVYLELYSLKTNEDAQAYDSHRVGPDHIAFEVDDLFGVLERLRAQDVVVLRDPFLPPTDDPQQPLVAFIQGIDGEEIELRACCRQDE